MSIKDDIKDQAEELELPQLLDADELIAAPRPTFEPIIEGVFDVGDKIAIIGPSKTRKTFFNLQMGISVSIGRTFLGRKVPKARRVAIVQFEIQDIHFQDRLQKMAKAMIVTTTQGNLKIINARGRGIIGAKGIEKIKKILKDFKPELVLFDPLYKVSEGDENAAQDMKVIMASFDKLMVDLHTACGYVHHDAKGTVGDRDARDRGAGSGVVGRDYDAAFVLSPQEGEEGTGIMVELLLRNYKPIEPFVALFRDNFEHDGYCFELGVGIEPKTKQSKQKSDKARDDADIESFLPIALEILKNKAIKIKPFRRRFKKKAKLTLARVQEFLDWATDEADPPKLKIYRIRGYKKNEDEIGIVGDPDFTKEDDEK